MQLALNIMRYTYIGIVIIGIILLILSLNVVFNPTISLTRGYYLTYWTSQYKKSDIVLLCVKNKEQTTIMHQLGLPYENGACVNNTPYLMKKIVGVSGDWVLVDERGVEVNGYLFPRSKRVLLQNGLDRALLLKSRFKLKANEYFVLGMTPHSYDSRYFGVVLGSELHAKAMLIVARDKLFW